MAIPFFRHMSDRDAKAIVVYLRQLKPVKNKVKKSVYRIPLPPAYGPPLGSVPDVSRADKVTWWPSATAWIATRPWASADAT